MTSLFEQNLGAEAMNDNSQPATSHPSQGYWFEAGSVRITGGFVDKTTNLVHATSGLVDSVTRLIDAKAAREQAAQEAQERADERLMEAARMAQQTNPFAEAMAGLFGGGGPF